MLSHYSSVLRGVNKLAVLLAFLIVVLVLALGIVKLSMPHAQCHQLSEAQILKILPSTANQYDLSANGYSFNACYYAVDVLIGASTPINDQSLDNPILGTWVISTRDLTVHRISTPKDYANVFHRWISDSQLLLNSDDGDVSAVYDTRSQAIVARTVNLLMLRFIRLLSDVSVTPLLMADVSGDPSCSKPVKTNEGFLFYAVSCLKYGPVLLTVPGYGSFTVKYGSSSEVYINGHSYDLSDTRGVEIDL
jgi:hypothetical protein